MRPLAVVVALALFGSLIAAIKHPVAPDEREAIRAAREAQNAAIARNDLTAIAATWTEDVSIRAGLGRSIQGRKDYLAAFAADSVTTYRRVPSEIIVSTHWPLAYERGKWRGSLRRSPNEALLSGEYSAQWVKSGGRWLIRSEVFVAIDCSGEGCRWPAVPGR